MMAESRGAQEEMARRCGTERLGEEGTWEMRPCRWVRGRKEARGSVHAKVLGQEDLTTCKVGEAGAREGDRRPRGPAG